MIHAATRLRWWLGWLAFVAGPLANRAAEVIPPPPENHFNDYAGAVPTAVARQLDSTLTQFERDTSNQIVVAIFPRMQSDSSIDDYSVRLYQAWHIGQKGRDNGALLLIFTGSHRMRIATGYGLEGALPDALCRRILDDEIAPRFRQGNFAGGITAGVQAMMAACRGEYHGTGRTARDARGAIGGINPIALLFAAFVIGSIILNWFHRNGGVTYTRRGRNTWVSSGWSGGFGGFGGGGGWSGGSGGSFGGGGGSFFGGGGSTGGGGASGSW